MQILHDWSPTLFQLHCQSLSSYYLIVWYSSWFSMMRWSWRCCMRRIGYIYHQNMIGWTLPLLKRLFLNISTTLRITRKILKRKVKETSKTLNSSSSIKWEEDIRYQWMHAHQEAETLCWIRYLPLKVIRSIKWWLLKPSSKIKVLHSQCWFRIGIVLINLFYPTIHSSKWQRALIWCMTKNKMTSYPISLETNSKANILKIPMNKIHHQHHHHISHTPSIHSRIYIIIGLASSSTSLNIKIILSHSHQINITRQTMNSNLQCLTPLEIHIIGQDSD